RQANTPFFRGCLLSGAVLMLAASGLEVSAYWQGGMRPQTSAYTAVVFAMVGWQCVLAIVVGVMTAFTLARSIAGRLDIERRACLDATQIMWHYTVVQGLLVLLL